MTYPNITAKDVEAKVREIAAADPDHVYTKGLRGRCTNIAYDGSEACLIGRALTDLGVPEALFIEKQLIEIGSLDTLAGLNIPGNTDWLDEVQDHQDSGREWGTAVDWADGDYESDEEEES